MRIKIAQGFTLMELMVVVIVLGVLASFAIPNFSRTLQRAEEQKMMTHIRTIVAAQYIYKAKHGFFWPPTAGYQGIAALNSALNINIPTAGTGHDYQCMTGGVSNYFRCIGSYSTGGVMQWQLHTNNGLANTTSFHANGTCCYPEYGGVASHDHPCPTANWCW